MSIAGVTLARCCVPNFELKPSSTKSDLLTAVKAVNSLNERCLQVISLVFSAENCVNALDHFNQVFN